MSSDDRWKHLEFIQTVIGRMSTASTLNKGWCLTVAIAALGFAVTKNSRSVGLLGGFAVFMFGLLDARYLREERKFRALYDDARRGRIAVYEMETREYSERGTARFSEACHWWSVLQSWSLWEFYGPLVVVAIAVVARAWISR